MQGQKSEASALPSVCFSCQEGMLFGLKRLQPRQANSAAPSMRRGCIMRPMDAAHALSSQGMQWLPASTLASRIK